MHFRTILLATGSNAIHESQKKPLKAWVKWVPLGVFPDPRRYPLIFIPSPFKNPLFYQFRSKEGNGLCTKPHAQLKQNPTRLWKWLLKPNAGTPNNYLHYPNSLETVLPLILANAKLLKSNQRQVRVFWMYPSTFSGYLGKSSIITTDRFSLQLAHARALEVIFWKVLS